MEEVFIFRVTLVRVIEVEVQRRDFFFELKVCRGCIEVIRSEWVRFGGDKKEKG